MEASGVASVRCSRSSSTSPLLPESSLLCGESERLVYAENSELERRPPGVVGVGDLYLDEVGLSNRRRGGSSCGDVRELRPVECGSRNHFRLESQAIF
jgi:hypothetical protein